MKQKTPKILLLIFILFAWATTQTSAQCPDPNYKIITTFNRTNDSISNCGSVQLIAPKLPGIFHTWYGFTPPSTYQPINQLDTFTIFNSGNEYTTIFLRTIDNKCSASITLKNVKDANVNLGKDTIICPGNSVLLRNNNRDQPGATYEWFKNTDPTVISTDNNYTTSEPGTYKLVQSVSSNCKGEDEINVIAAPPLFIDLQDTIAICEGAVSYSFSIVKGGSTFYNPLVITPSGTGIIDTLATSVKISGMTGKVGYQSVEITGQDAKCLTNTVQKTVVLNTLNASAIIFSPSVIELKPGNEVVLQPVSLRSPNYTYRWLLDGPGIFLSSDSIYTTSEYGTYVLTVTNQANQCTSNGKVIVIPPDNSDKNAVFVPTAFSPSSENIENRSLKLLGGSFFEENFSFVIIDRWGHTVFESNSYIEVNTIGWNGKLKNSGDELPQGVYSYGLSGKLQTGKTIKQSGKITMLR